MNIYNKWNGLKIGIAVCLLLTTALAHATFKAREQRWAAQIQETLFTGEAVWLVAQQKPKDVKFFALYTPAHGKTTQGGILVLHDNGQHPDWPDVTSLLRRELPEHGWATLSMQMPILPYVAPITAFGPIFDETPPRIRAGIEFLRSKGIRRIIIAGHGTGASMAAAFLAQQPNSGISGLVGVAFDAPVINNTIDKLDPRLYSPTMLARIKVPVLDIYGGLDTKTVTGSTELRSQAAKKAGNKNFEQVRIPDADHQFGRYEKDLVKHIVDWLAQQFGAR
ncbi:MAG TPA: DUF3530 family protein [Gammaproteobacteria bacterium]|nr:DUF3530 family protein [Gammaproteobacteria bacterium]